MIMFLQMLSRNNIIFPLILQYLYIEFKTYVRTLSLISQIFYLILCDFFRYLFFFDNDDHDHRNIEIRINC